MASQHFHFQKSYDLVKSFIKKLAVNLCSTSCISMSGARHDDDDDDCGRDDDNDGDDV